MAVLKETALARLIERIKGTFAQIKDTVFSVNGTAPVDGNVTIDKVNLADNLDTSMSQTVSGDFIMRTTGGSISLDDGDGWLNRVFGGSVHTGYVAESLEMSVAPMPREEGEPITAELNRETFIGAVSDSGTYQMVFTTEWSVNPATYGVTVTGTPVAGDTITIDYTAENRGTITVCNPLSFHSTGWNLYNSAAGYSRVVRYSDEYGYKIGGAYTKIEFATTVSGTRTTIEDVEGYFNVPSDGYLFITGGNSTTYIYTTWSDWQEGYEGDFMPYTDDSISLTTVMQSYFPNGLMQVGDVRDEININLGIAISRIQRMEYSAENLTSVIASGAEYEYDENFIYVVKAEEDTYSIDIDGSYMAYEHGLEFYEGTMIPVDCQMIYGVNLKNRLERDVVTISSGLANNLNTTESGMALDARQGKVLGDRLTAKKTLYEKGTEIPDGSTLSEIKTPGTYYTVSSGHTATLTDSPITTAGIVMIVIQQGASTANVHQLLFSNQNSKGFWHRFITGTTSYGWLKTAEYGDEGTNLQSTFPKSYTAGVASNGSTKTYNISNSCRARFDVISTNTGHQGTIYVGASSNGTVTYSTIGNLGGITITKATNRLTIANSESVLAGVYITCYNGTVTIVEEENT